MRLPTFISELATCVFVTIVVKASENSFYKRTYLVILKMHFMCLFYILYYKQNLLNHFHGFFVPKIFFFCFSRILFERANVGGFEAYEIVFDSVNLYELVYTIGILNV